MDRLRVHGSGDPPRGRRCDPLGTASDDYAPCEDNGQNCTDEIQVFKVSSTLPSAVRVSRSCAIGGSSTRDLPVGLRAVGF